MFICVTESTDKSHLALDPTGSYSYSVSTESTDKIDNK